MYKYLIIALLLCSCSKSAYLFETKDTKCYYDAEHRINNSYRVVIQLKYDGMNRYNDGEHVSADSNGIIVDYLTPNAQPYTIIRKLNK